MDPTLVFFTRHVTERLREHHPRAGFNGARAILGRSVEIERESAAGILGRKTGGTPDRYFLTQDRQGIFVIASSTWSEKYPWTAITYVRLGDGQQELVKRLWP